MHKIHSICRCTWISVFNVQKDIIFDEYNLQKKVKFWLLHRNLFLTISYLCKRVGNTAFDFIFEKYFYSLYHQHFILWILKHDFFLGNKSFSIQFLSWNQFLIVNDARTITIFCDFAFWLCGCILLSRYFDSIYHWPLEERKNEKHYLKVEIIFQLQRSFITTTKKLIKVVKESQTKSIFKLARPLIWSLLWIVYKTM